MSKVVHRAGEQTVEKYEGFGNYTRIFAPLCDGAKGLYAGKTYLIHRNWAEVTCKKCLKKRRARV